MKKTYQSPELESVALRTCDIIAWSGTTEEDEIDKLDVTVSAYSAWFSTNE